MGKDTNKKFQIDTNGKFDEVRKKYLWTFKVIECGLVTFKEEGEVKVMNPTLKIAQYGAIIEALRWLKNKYPNELVSIFIPFSNRKIIDYIYGIEKLGGREISNYESLIKILLNNTKAVIKIKKIGKLNIRELIV